MRTFADNFQRELARSTIEPRFSIALSHHDEGQVDADPNLLFQSEDMTAAANWIATNSPTITANTTVAPDGTTTADTVADNNVGSTAYIRQTTSSVDSSRAHTESWFILKDSTGRATRFAAVALQFAVGATAELNEVRFDTSTGEYNLATAQSDDVEAGVEDYDGTYWRVWITAKSTAGTHTVVYSYLYPARGASATWVISDAAQGSVIVWGAQLAAATSALEYFPTTTTQQTIGSADTDVTWITSHADALVLPGVSSVDRIDGAIMRRGISGTTQKMDYLKGRFSIGTLTLKLTDAAGALSDKIKAKLDDGEGVRYKRVRVYMGLAPLSAWTDYAPIATYIIDGVEYHNSVYTIRCSDVQRIAKAEIFDPHQGVLTRTIGPNASEIPVTIADAANKFPLVEHDSIYATHPSDSVGYIKIEDEWICHDGWTDGTYTKLNVVQRGAFNTLPARHVVTEPEISKRKKVTEQIYLEGAAPRIAYYLLTGKDPAGALADLPDHWHAGIDEAYVRLSDFETVGPDLWNTATDRGRLVRFIGVKATDAKKFIETEICVWLGCFMPIYADGALGFRRYGGTLPESAYVMEINPSDIVAGRSGPLKHDLKALVNNISIQTNWNPRLERFLQIDGLIDAGSIAKHGTAPLKSYEFQGVFTGVHSDADRLNFFTDIRDRFSNPPVTRDMTLIPEFAVLEVGDTVRVIDPLCRDFNRSTTLDRAMMITQMRPQWDTGLMRVSLFGGVEKSTEEVISDSHVLIDATYIQGTELSTVLTISGDAITANGTLNGGGDGSSNNFYYLGNLTLNAGVTLTINRNVRLWIRGTFTRNGTIELDGHVDDDGLGATNSGYSAEAYVWHRGQDQVESGGVLQKYRQANTRTGTFPNGLPVFNILNPDGASVEGIPTDIGGRRGAPGQPARVFTGFGSWGPAFSREAAGGAGGVGGGGLVMICRGFANGPAGTIDCSGTAGTAGSTAQSDETPFVTVRGQTGAGGFPGGILILIDGNYSAPIFDATNITANRGDALMPVSVDVNLPEDKGIGQGGEGYGQNIGVDSFNYWQACTRVQYIPEAADGFLWLPEDDRRNSDPRRNLTDLLITNLEQLVTDPDGPFTAAAARPGLFVIAGLSSGTDTEILTSVDGRNWTERSNPGTASADDTSGICEGGGYFVICMGDLVSTGAIMHSTDGITWTKVTPTNASAFRDVAFGDGVFVLVGNDDATDASLFTATDPATWTERANPKAFDLRAVVYAAELDLWIAGGQADGTDAYLITASDPTGTWTERTNPVNGTIRGLAAGNGLVVGVGSNAAGTGPYVIYSSDGSTWIEPSTYPVTDETLLRVRFIDGVFYAVGTFDDTTVGAVLWLSEDCENWYRVQNVAPQQLEDIAFDGSRFVLPVGVNQEGILISPRVDTL